jgi:hypothetical protein
MEKQKLKNLKLTLINEIKDILESSNYNNFNYHISYPSNTTLQLPAVSIDFNRVIPDNVEIGSSKTANHMFFAIDIFARNKGELSDVAYLITSELKDLELHQIIASGWSNTNLIQNPNFDSWEHWADRETNSLDDVTSRCTPLPGICVYYSSCPWASRTLESPEWYLSNEFKIKGNYSATIFVEQQFSSATCNSDFLTIQPNTYLLSGTMYKEQNFTNNMCISITESGGDLLTQTPKFNDANSQQSSSRIWKSLTKEYSIDSTKNIYLQLSIEAKNKFSLEFGLPCIHNTHAAWDSVGLFAKEFVRDEKTLYIEELTRVNRYVDNGTYSAIIGCGVIAE